MKIEIREIPRINGCKEAVHLHPVSGNTGSPLLYLDELYQYYEKTRELERTCKKAAAIFVAGMDYVSRFSMEHLVHIPKDRIIFTVVHQEENSKLLEQVPHRKTLDLALIYRVMLENEQGSFHSAVLTHELADGMGVTEDELYELALENTPRLLPADLEGSPGVFRIVTNERRTLGAAAMMYPGLLAGLAEEFDADLFILPSSIHEVFVIPDVGQDFIDMNRIVEEANGCVVDEDEILSNHVYYYHKDNDKVTIPPETSNNYRRVCNEEV